MTRIFTNHPQGFLQTEQNRLRRITKKYGVAFDDILSIEHQIESDQTIIESAKTIDNATIFTTTTITGGKLFGKN